MVGAFLYLCLSCLVIYNDETRKFFHAPRFRLTARSFYFRHYLRYFITDFINTLRLKHKLSYCIHMHRGARVSRCAASPAQVRPGQVRAVPKGCCRGYVWGCPPRSRPAPPGSRISWRRPSGVSASRSSPRDARLMHNRGGGDSWPVDTWVHGAWNMEHGAWAWTMGTPIAVCARPAAG